MGENENNTLHELLARAIFPLPHRYWLKTRTGLNLSKKSNHHTVCHQVINSLSKTSGQKDKHVEANLETKTAEASLVALQTDAWSN